MKTQDLFDDLPSQVEQIEFTPTRESGLARLDKFTSRAGRHYAAQRNYDLGPNDRSNVSALSPWIRHGLISEIDVLERVLAKHSYPAAEKFVQEVLWRSYFKGWLEHRPSVWSQYCKDRDILLSEGPSKTYYDAIQGRTGIDCFDHWVIELQTTGYLHNHARMWFASIWIFTLRLPWQLGADFFMQNLLDGDPASNTLSWRWVGGLHTVGKTYLARPDNIATFTDGRFNPLGLSTVAESLFEDQPPTKQNIRFFDQVATQNSVLLVTEDNVQPQVSQPKLQSVIALNCARERSPNGVNPVVDNFVQGALLNGYYEASRIATPDTLIDCLIDETQRTGIKDIVTEYAPIGPVADVLRKIIPVLTSQGIRLTQVSRRYDQATWPHASKGFFALKKEIPAILKHLGLAQ